ncbi:Antirestriction protein klcA (plasmid) [Collimonas arenae]|uniref:Antirestriction protein klcA n=1 Tax=Collimonas arenae TaxID=279058 RepID=A0A0A1FHI9_9BURK|nr:antirestriction protein [Collimonas arenae]AIY44228.1 Antirestriction protein klcA [Collimonas arenae]
MNNTQINQAVTASLVEEDRRLNFLPTYFGQHFVHAEFLVYRWLDKLCDAYNGGYWHYYELSNGGFYMAPKLSDSLLIEVSGNGYSGLMSADAAGIVATLFALGQLANKNHGTVAADALIDRYHLLREFLDGHIEAGKIFAAID